MLPCFAKGLAPVALQEAHAQLLLAAVQVRERIRNLNASHGSTETPANRTSRGHEVTSHLRPPSAVSKPQGRAHHLRSSAQRVPIIQRNTIITTSKRTCSCEKLVPPIERRAEQW